MSSGIDDSTTTTTTGTGEVTTSGVTPTGSITRDIDDPGPRFIDWQMVRVQGR